jgi:hypothetical protein
MWDGHSCPSLAFGFVVAFDCLSPDDPVGRLSAAYSLADRSVRPPHTKKADGRKAIRLQSNGEEIGLGHFDNMSQLGLAFSVGRSRILCAQQPGGDPERFHLFPNPHQLLLFGPENVVRILHSGGPLAKNSGIARLSKTTVRDLSAGRNLPEVHPGREPSRVSPV